MTEKIVATRYSVIAGIYFRSHPEAVLMLEILEHELRERSGTAEEATITKWFNELSGIRSKATSQQWGGWQDVWPSVHPAQ